MIRTVVAPERKGDLIGLALADLDDGQLLELPGELETVVVVLGGVVDVEAAGVARSLGVTFARTPSLNDDPEFLDILANVIRAAPASTLR